MSDNSGATQSYRLSELLSSSGTYDQLTLRDIVRGWWETSRMEYLPDAVVYVALPLLLVLRHEPWSTRLLPLVFWGLLLWLIGHWTGSSLNCLADYPVDQLDVGHKARLATAIDRAGFRSLLLVNLVEILLATGLSVWLAISLGKPLLLAFWLVGLLVACLYSFEPTHLKRRNLLNPAALMLIVYAMPLFFVYHLLSPIWDRYDMAVLSIYCLQMVPMFLVDEVSDYDEDRVMQIYNPCVTYGRVWTSWLANGIYILACLASLIVFATQLDAWSTGRIVVVLLALCAYLWVIREFILLARLSRAVADTSDPGARADRTQVLKRFLPKHRPGW